MRFCFRRRALSLIYRRYLFAYLGDLGLKRGVSRSDSLLLLAQTFTELLRTLHAQLLRRLRGGLRDTDIAIGRPCAFAKSAFRRWDAGSRDLSFLRTVACNHNLFWLIFVGCFSAGCPRY